MTVKWVIFKWLICKIAEPHLYVCIYIYKLLLIEGVCRSTLITKNCFTCSHLFSLTSLDFNAVVEGLGVGQQDCG